MNNADVFKTTVEEDLKEIGKCKVDILVLQREIEKDALVIKNLAEIKRLNNVIANRELTAKSQLKKFVCDELGMDFIEDGLGEETEEFKKLWREGVAKLELEERKIKTSAGSVIYKVMPDKWNYDDPKIIDWAKENKLPYYKIIEEVKKAELKKDIQNEIFKLEEVPGITITPQDPKFNYKLQGGL